MRSTQANKEKYKIKIYVTQQVVLSASNQTYYLAKDKSWINFMLYNLV